MLIELTIRNIALIEVKNIFAKGDELEVFGPHLDNKRFKAEVMFDEKYNIVELTGFLFQK